MKETEALALLKKFKAGNCTKKELAALESWYLQWNTEANSLSEESLMQLKEEMWAALPEEVKEKNGESKTVKLWPRIAAAAAIFLVVGAGLFFYTSYYASHNPESSRHLDDRRDLLNYANDISPGKNTATITLANGSTIVLSDAKTGVVVGAESLTYNDNSLVQGASGTHFSGPLKGDQKNTAPLSTPSSGVEGVHSPGAKDMLTASTPRGGTYQITLPDGTKVWLNAASSLKFPSTFKELKNRKVELTGEGYFEVAKDKAHPFIVATSKQEVEVLGTHFNINSYADEPNTKTTLLEGSVRVFPSSLLPAPSSRGKRSDENRALRELSAAKSLGHATSRDLSYRRDDGASRNNGTGRNDVTLKPGQQSINIGKQITVNEVNAELAVAWKNGNFSFVNQPIEAVMKSIARWYNVEVVYEGQIPDISINAAISRNRSISQVLKMMEKTKEVKFRLEERKVYVSR
jgi:ferric-dicitrate binding protein FerR (iron transport regulator)